MSVLNKDGTSVYDHLNKTDPVAVVLDLDALAERLESRNYGTVRFLAALLRVRERLHAERVAKYRVNSKTQDHRRLGRAAWRRARARDSATICRRRMSKGARVSAAAGVKALDAGVWRCRRRLHVGWLGKKEAVK